MSMLNDKFISIIIPAYDIVPKRRVVDTAMDSLDYEIITQYDVDGEGKGITLQRGFKRAKGSLIVWLDADMEVHPSQIWKMMLVMKEEKADVVIGSKRHKDSIVYYPLARKALSWVGSWIIKILFNMPYNDTQTGLKLFKRKVLEGKWKVKGFGHDVEVLYRAHNKGYNIIEAPVIIPVKKKGSINAGSVLSMLKEIVWLRLKLRS